MGWPGARRPSCLSLLLCTLMAVHSLALILFVSSHLLVSISTAIFPFPVLVLFLLSVPLHLCHFLILLAGDAHGGRDIHWSYSLPCSHHPAGGLGHQHCQLNEWGNNEWTLSCWCRLPVPESLCLSMSETSLSEKKKSRASDLQSPIPSFYRWDH